MKFFSHVFVKVLLCVWCLINCYCQAHPTDSNYMSLRQQLIEEEQRFAFGANITLHEDEITANECLMIVKKNEVDEGKSFFCCFFYVLFSYRIFPVRLDI